MKKIYKLMCLFIFMLLIICLNKTTKANSISSISMDIYVDKNGNAQVTEVWDCTTNQGTEVYHPYYNLGNSKISNLRVSENNTNYTQLDKWYSSNTFSSKAYKCGINTIYNGVELCWGMSSYGKHIYTVKYNISNFVSELTDSQMIYWTLIPYDFSNTIGNASIKIYTDSYIQDTIDVWGYGDYGGLCYVNNGAIYMNSNNSIKSNEYMTFLAKFPKGTFNASNKLNYNFEHFYQMAQEGSVKYNSKKTSPLSVIVGLITMILLLFPLIIVSFIARKESGYKYGFYYGKPGRIKRRKIDYYRDIPCDGDLLKTYYIAYNYGLVKKKTDILGAIILKWLKAGIIKIENRQVEKVFNKEDTVIILGQNKVFENDRERILFEMMLSASKDGILENKEFEIWCKRSYSRILDWFDIILREQRNRLDEQGYFIIEKDKYYATNELKEEAIRIAGLRRFLLNYSLIAKREAIEVELFENYLIYAQMLGIAKKVSKQFKELYPDMIEQTNFNSYDNMLYIHDCSSRAIISANSAKAAAESYSSGGGGFSSGGGGGGSFGGGGGRRRIPLKRDI